MQRIAEGRSCVVQKRQFIAENYTPKRKQQTHSSHSKSTQWTLFNLTVTTYTQTHWLTCLAEVNIFPTIMQNQLALLLGFFTELKLWVSVNKNEMYLPKTSKTPKVFARKKSFKFSRLSVPIFLFGANVGILVKNWQERANHSNWQNSFLACLYTFCKKPHRQQTTIREFREKNIRNGT